MPASKWIPLVLIIVLCNLKSFGQLKWDSSSSIKWNNFKGIPNSNFKYEANTYSIINCEYAGSGNCFFYKVEALFLEEKSWCYIDTTNNLLKHEQGHFDISEIYARMIRRYLEMNLKKGVANSTIQKGIDSLQRLKNQCQDLYDRETNHSQDISEQIKWQIKIKDLLRSLNYYSITSYNNCDNTNDSN
jgi:hypothetical protein